MNCSWLVWPVSSFVIMIRPLRLIILPRALSPKLSECFIFDSRLKRLAAPNKPFSSIQALHPVSDCDLRLRGLLVLEVSHRGWEKEPKVSLCSIVIQTLRGVEYREARFRPSSWMHASIESSYPPPPNTSSTGRSCSS